MRDFGARTSIIFEVCKSLYEATIQIMMGCAMVKALKLPQHGAYREQ